MRRFWSLQFLFIFISTTYVYSSEIGIYLKGETIHPQKLSVVSYNTLLNKEILKEFTLKDNNREEIELNFNQPQFISIQGSVNSPEYLILPNQQYLISYDISTKAWRIENPQNEQNTLRLQLMNKILNISIPKDSVEFIDAVGRWKEMTNETLARNNSSLDDESKHYIKRAVFNKLVGINNRNRYVNFALKENEVLREELTELLDLQSMDLKTNSQNDLLCLFNFHIVSAEDIYSNPVAERDDNYYHLFLKSEAWVSTLKSSETVKQYLLGDIIQLSLRVPMGFDEKAFAYLNKFTISNPESRHSSFINNELKRRNLNKESVFKDTNYKNRNGELLKISEVREKLIFIDFWATWCGPCKIENESIKAIEEKFKDQVKFVRISVDENYDQWLKHEIINNSDPLKSYILSGENISSVITELSLETVPRFLIVNNKGEIVDRNPIRPSNKEFQRFIENLVALRIN